MRVGAYCTRVVYERGLGRDSAIDDYGLAAQVVHRLLADVIGWEPLPAAMASEEYLDDLSTRLNFRFSMAQVHPTRAAACSLPNVSPGPPTHAEPPRRLLHSFSVRFPSPPPSLAPCDQYPYYVHSPTRALPPYTLSGCWSPVVRVSWSMPAPHCLAGVGLAVRRAGVH